jgi:hypothetical protein
MESDLDELGGGPATSSRALRRFFDRSGNLWQLFSFAEGLFELYRTAADAYRREKVHIYPSEHQGYLIRSLENRALTEIGATAPERLRV